MGFRGLGFVGFRVSELGFRGLGFRTEGVWGLGLGVPNFSGCRVGSARQGFPHTDNRVHGGKSSQLRCFGFRGGCSA